MAGKQFANFLFSLLTAFAFFTFSNFSSAQSKPPNVIEEIKKAWEKRQQFTQSVRFTFKIEEIYPKGSISTELDPLLSSRMPEAEGKIMPPEDSNIHFDVEMAFEDDKVRIEYQGQIWSVDDLEFIPIKYLSTFDGFKPKDLYPKHSEKDKFPAGAIRNTKDYGDAGLALVKPLIMVYRPFAPKLQPVNLAELQILPDLVEINGCMCLELVQKHLRGKGSSIRMWVDPARDYVLVRHLVEANYKPNEQIDFVYRLDPSSGWIVNSWKLIALGKKGLLHYSMNSSVNLSDFKYAGAPDTFDLQFPAGTLVSDERTNERFLVRLDGSKRVLPSSDNIPYDDLIKEKPWMIWTLWSNNWKIIFATVIGMTALLVFLRRRLILGLKPNK